MIWGKVRKKDLNKCHDQNKHASEYKWSSAEHRRTVTSIP